LTPHLQGFNPCITCEGYKPITKLCTSGVKRFNTLLRANYSTKIYPVSFNPLGKIGDLNKLRKDAQAMQQALAAEEIVVEENDIKVVMTGDQKIKELSVKGISNDILINTLNKALKKSQEVAAKKLAQMSGGLSGMLGRMGQ